MESSNENISFIANSNAPASTSSSLSISHHGNESRAAFSFGDLNFSSATTAASTLSNGFNFGGKVATVLPGDFKFGPTNILDKHKSLAGLSEPTLSQFDSLIMDCASCDVCFQDFDDLKCIPKVLGCGHSICSVCLITLLDSKKSCPKCFEPLQKSPVEEYPTNYDLLSLSNSIRKYACTEPHVVCSLESLKKLLIIRRESLVKTIGDRMSLKNLMTNDIARIEQMIDLDKDVLVPGEAKNLIKDVQNNIEKVEKVLNCCCNPIIKQTYSLTQYKNATQFLYDLSIRLYKRESIYACEMVDGQLKYGKIEFDDDRISVHALTSFSVHKYSSVVSLRDLKKCLTPKNFLVFITIGKRTLSFKLQSSSILALQFIKLCTGETGPVLVGSSVAMRTKVIDQPLESSNANLVTIQSEKSNPIFGARSQPTGSGAFSSQPTGSGAFSSPSTGSSIFSATPPATATKFSDKRNGSNESGENISVIKMISIENYMTNSIKTDGCIDYDISVFNKQVSNINFNIGSIVLECSPQGKCHIYKNFYKSNSENIVAVLVNKNKIDIDSISGYVDNCGIGFLM